MCYRQLLPLTFQPGQSPSGNIAVRPPPAFAVFYSQAAYTFDGAAAKERV
jgi:hypothetical protein